ncbi:hypothetical protein F3Y22_tig00018999pilonHSYRG00028 [Hibiscus syriacus]|uniref:RNase H type-1 domain-containing protein n=1 Tax=Hibiscus syriacus TaxID=106335 RepID=A0A6A3C060_HIBSY|nr:hypothetical protein F3Y22_tig00018999pilonHSYRG00028 [Hibiscus syriacus]
MQYEDRKPNNESPIHFAEETSTGSRRNVNWKPPPPGVIKLNTDGAVQPNTMEAVSGGVLRDNSGRWITRFCRNIGSCPIIQADTWAVLDGLEIAWKRNIRHLEVNIDNIEVV